MTVEKSPMKAPVRAASTKPGAGAIRFSAPCLIGPILPEIASAAKGGDDLETADARRSRIADLGLAITVAGNTTNAGETNSRTWQVVDVDFQSDWMEVAPREVEDGFLPLAEVRRLGVTVKVAGE